MPKYFYSVRSGIHLRYGVFESELHGDELEKIAIEDARLPQDDGKPLVHCISRVDNSREFFFFAKALLCSAYGFLTIEDGEDIIEKVKEVVRKDAKASLPASQDDANAVINIYTITAL
jgi:hypothetical protein